MDFCSNTYTIAGKNSGNFQVMRSISSFTRKLVIKRKIKKLGQQVIFPYIPLLKGNVRNAREYYFEKCSFREKCTG